MAQQYNKLPQYAQTVMAGPVTDKTWFFFFAALYRGLAPAAQENVPVTPSPMTYIAPVKGFVIVHGGTVSQLRFSRDGTNFYDLGVVAGQITLNAADRLVITYGSAPTLTFVPT